jgi:2-polyprenyl-3-methyl-5-hydroxy-6-metoxy-1,4-benzoquinol methylase
MAKYEAEIDLRDENQSHAVIVNLVGRDKRVLDVGCSTGYVARGLASRGCTVSGVELEEEWAAEARPVLEQLVVGDLDVLDLVEAFGEESFDAVVFGDVLEHVKDPARVLLQARRLLSPRGSVVISMPNVAHGDLRLSLLAGHWDYRSVGLLDETHLRFFTRVGVERLMSDTGFAIVDMRRVRVPLFGTELAMSERDFSAEVVRQLRRDPDIDVYQYVFRALKDDVDAAVATLHALAEERREQQAVLEARLASVHEELAAVRDAELVRVRDTELARARAERVERDLAALQATRTLRYARLPRAAWSRVRGRR